MKTRFLTLDDIVADIMEDYDLSEKEVDEELIKKWAEDCIKKVSTDEQLIPKIKLKRVENYKAVVGKDVEFICEILYNKDPVKSNKINRREYINQYVQKVNDECELEINLKCPDCHKEKCSCNSDEVIVDVDRIWEISNAQYNYPLSYGRLHNFGKGLGRKEEEDFFVPLRCASNNWDQKRRHIKNCLNFNCNDCEHSYVLNLPNIDVDFEKGNLLVSCLTRATDGNGDLLVPDNPDVFEAVSNYVIYKMTKKQVYNLGKDAKRGDLNLYQDARQEYETSLGRARNALQMPSAESFNNWYKNNVWHRLGQKHLDRLEGRAPSRRRSPRRTI